MHTVETFTTAVSGISHALHKNVNWKLFLRIAVPGVIGGALGAYVLSNIHALDRQAVHPRLSDRNRPLFALAQPPLSAARAQPQDRRATRASSAASSTLPAAAAGVRW